MANEVIVITGARGTGKSMLAATFLPPGEIKNAYVHDSEDSMNRIRADLQAKGLDFGHYVNLKARFDLPASEDLLDRIDQGKLPWVDERGRSSLESYWRYILSDLAKNLTAGRYRVYIHDTLEKMEAGMWAWVEAHKKQAGVTVLGHGKLWTEGVYPLYEHFLEAIFERGVETVMLCSHLKTPWEQNRPVAGKVAPSGKKLLYRLSSLMLWLVHDYRNEDGAPAALVLKERLGKLEPHNSGEWQVRRMLPERIPHCTWHDIRAYLANGCDLANPRDGECMSEEEQEMISELLTDKQMQLMILGAEKELEEVRQQSSVVFPQQVSELPEELSEELREELSKEPVESRRGILELAATGKQPLEIAKKLGIPLPMVLRELRSQA